MSTNPGKPMNWVWLRFRKGGKIHAAVSGNHATDVRRVVYDTLCGKLYRPRHMPEYADECCLYPEDWFCELCIELEGRNA